MEQGVPLPSTWFTITPLSVVPLLLHCLWYHCYSIVHGNTITPLSMVPLLPHCPWYHNYPIVHGSVLLQSLAPLCSQYSVHCVWMFSVYCHHVFLHNTGSGHSLVITVTWKSQNSLALDLVYFLRSLEGLMIKDTRPRSQRNNQKQKMNSKEGWVI